MSQARIEIDQRSNGRWAVTEKQSSIPAAFDAIELGDFESHAEARYWQLRLEAALNEKDATHLVLTEARRALE